MKTIILRIALIALACSAYGTASSAVPRPDTIRRPSLEMSAYRRVFTTDEPVSIRLSSYNEKAVGLTVYHLNLTPLIPTSKALEDFGKRLKGVNAARLSRAQSFPLQLGRVYPDQWSEHEVRVPHLAPGVYVIVARGAGAETRTWFAVTDIALLAKRSRQELLVYAADARSGRPVPNLALTTTNASGMHLQGVTGSDGL